MSLLSKLLEGILLAIALSTDAFAASITYGANRILIPTRSTAIISTICAGMLGLALLFGAAVSMFIAPTFSYWLSFGLLFSLGVFRLFDNIIKHYIRKHNKIRFKFSFVDLNFLLVIYANAETADIDSSKTLSSKEAVYLATALSIDSLAVGIGAGISSMNILLPTIITLVFTFLVIKAGYYLGYILTDLIPFDLSYLSSLLLILLSFLRL